MSEPSKPDEIPAQVAQPTKLGSPEAPETPGAEPRTDEIGGPKGPEPTRFGDWERKGRCIDF